jgi:hypothetical protein
VVIPGHAEGVSPEPMNTTQIFAALPRPHLSTVVFMGSGLFAARSPGMTKEVHRASNE